MRTQQQGERTVTDERVARYGELLVREGKSAQTVAKYVRDVRKLQGFLAGRELTQELLVRFREHLEGRGEYAAASINSFLAAANSFCKCMGWEGLHVRTIRIQRQPFEAEERELTAGDYRRLVGAALRQGNVRLALVIQALASTGIRISELRFVTLESLERGMAEVRGKGKVRRILYPAELVAALRAYAKKRGIANGCVFCTKTGKPLDRSNAWREMKALCGEAGVPAEKVFPHNLRHLFARRFYRMQKDIALLADILGHSDIATTQIYIKSSGREHRRQLDRMRMVLGQTLPGRPQKAGKKSRKRKSRRKCRRMVGK